MKTNGMLIALGLAALSLAASAQAEQVLKGAEITKGAMISALIPTTRNFGPAKGSGAAKQSILITFETNSTELTPEAKRSLDVVGQALNDNQLIENKFIVEGHADPRGTADWNQQLSEGRADAVRQYLVQNANVSEARLKSIGKGATEPLNETNPAAPENRRVTIITAASF